MTERGAAMFKRAIVVAFVLTVAWLVTTPPAYSDDWNKLTRFTVNQPFEIPGMVLPAGTYVMKIVDLVGERHVVRILSEDESTIYATVIGIPDFRLEPTDRPVITFYESASDSPRPLHTWFYPGRQYGIAFAYPEKRATEIAKVEEAPVVAFKEPAPILREKPSSMAVPDLLETPLVSVTAAGEEIDVGEISEPITENLISEGEPPLPKTATPFPLIALSGLLAAAGAGTVRWLHR
jgi:hypothetical protein